MYYLIITILLANFQAGSFAAIHEIEFADETKCELAKNAYLAANVTYPKNLLTAVCVGRN